MHGGSWTLPPEWLLALFQTQLFLSVGWDLILKKEGAFHKGQIPATRCRRDTLKNSRY